MDCLVRFYDSSASDILLIYQTELLPYVLKSLIPGNVFFAVGYHQI